ncbi:hypothetical protein PV08_03855 [Exophiala spinifera]|uniref:MICOS complex subunit MIC12 n=1 Tax=Exophiala spinifera TaxID=91928 RepID=A0A0D1ZVB2_9EURO|nr:uncharacterized protein PV08_03855 [Exophiala spinifera]KIW16667.1 hypothetical protein PV08_03855 [Exophiala spinifera]
MGFTTGFPFKKLGGMTLTYSILYMSLYVHRTNRHAQRTLLRQQATLLNSAVDPLPPLPDPPAYEVRKAGLVEELKDRWNSEVETIVRNLQTTDWAAKRAQWEDTAAAAWTKIRSSQAAQQLETRAKDTATEVERNVSQLVSEGKAAAKDAKDKVVQSGEQASEKAKRATREPRLLELK